MKGRLPVPVALLLAGIVFLVSTCANFYSESLAGAVNSQDQYAEELPPASEQDPDSAEDPNYFYFSYDDSASTAAVELAKYKLGLAEIPDTSLARPWEFLNFEILEPDVTEGLGDFQVSFGLWERDRVHGSTDDNLIEYKLGVYVASPEKTRTDSCVLTLVVDTSGSMSSEVVRTDDGESNTRMEVLKAGLDALVRESLIQGDIVNLVTFSTEAAVVFSGREYPEDSSYILDAIDDLAPEGSTNLGAGIDKAYEAAIQTYDDEKINRVILLTDAWLNTGETDTAIIAEKTRINDMEGIYFAGVGISGDINEAALNELTEAGKGAYFAVLTRQDAMNVFTDKFVALLEVAARNVRFRLDFPESLTHDTTASEESSTVESEVTPTNFSFNTSQYFFEGFTADSQIGGDETFTLTVSYTDPASGEAEELISEKTVSSILGTDLDQIRDAETIFLFTELIGERIEPGAIDAIFEAYYVNRTSTIFDEYSALIDTYNQIQGSE